MLEGCPSNHAGPPRQGGRGTLTCMDSPEVHYARSGGVAIAYQVVGDGPQTLVYAPPVTNLYSLWELPRAASFLRCLSEEAPVVVFNPRGTGLSDRPPNLTLESRTDDLNAVLDGIGCERAAIFGADVSANVCALFAATYPERCDRLACSFRTRARSAPTPTRTGRRRSRHSNGFGSGEVHGETATTSSPSHARSSGRR